MLSVEVLAALWRKTNGQREVEKRVFTLPPQDSNTATFKMKYDRTQKQLQSIAAMDDLLSGI